MPRSPTARTPSPPVRNPQVLQSLVDDDLVHSERIGASNYFWSFPAEASTKARVAGVGKGGWMRLGAGWGHQQA